MESAIQAMEEPQMALYLQVLPGEQGRRDTGGLGLPWGCVEVRWFSEGRGAPSQVCTGGAVLTQKDLWMPLGHAGVDLWWGHV